MAFIDISVPLQNGMAVWPGDPEVALRQVSSIKAGDEANVTQMRMSVHTGTHIDAPRHFIPDGKTVGSIPLEKLVGKVYVMDLGEETEVISEAVLTANERFAELAKAKKVLFKTQNSTLWSTHPGEFQTDYVGLDLSGAMLLASLALDLIGVDYLSVARFSETKLPHKMLLGKETVLLEGVDLSKVSGGWYQLFCLPINLAQCEGAPARAILASETVS